MPPSEYGVKENIKKKRIIGIVAIALLLFVSVLAFAGIIPFLIWIILDLIIAGVANLALRRIGRRPV